MEVMKIRLLAILIPLTCIFSACSEKDIETFHGRHQIYFDKFYMNALYPGTEEADTHQNIVLFLPGEYVFDNGSIGRKSFRSIVGCRLEFWIEIG